MRWISRQNGFAWFVFGIVLCLSMGGSVCAAVLLEGRGGGPYEALSPTIVKLRNDRSAFDLYMLNCGGCHRANGEGAPNYGVPSFVHSAGMFTWIPAGRQYLIRVPGSSMSQLTNGQLAEVLNWIVATFSPNELPTYFVPFTAAEVKAVRAHHYKDVAVARARVAKELRPLGLRPSRYTFGRGDHLADLVKH